MTKPVRDYRRSVPRVEVGDIDTMSVLARQCSLPICRVPRCTRAAGHTEDVGTLHVAAPTGVAEAIWE